MAELIRDWAGKERLFRLQVGEVLDLEQACDSGVAAIYGRLVGGQFKVNDLWHTIRLGLIGGGLDSVTAKALVAGQFDRKPYVEHAALAAEILVAIMTGVEAPSEPAEPGASGERMKFSELSQIGREFSLSPLDLRAMRYADLLNLLRGYKAAGKAAEAPSEAEFEEMLARHLAREEGAS